MRDEKNTPFDYAPNCVKKLVQSIIIATLVAISLNGIAPTISLFSLNMGMIHSWYIWQPITALFVVPAYDLSLSSLFDLFFAMLILYSAGKTVVFAFGKKHFLTLYALGGLVSGATALLSMNALRTSYPFTEVLPGIFAVFIAWTMLIPYQNLFLYFLVPIKASWILIAALVSTIVLNAAQGDYVRAASYCSAAIAGYTYCLLALGLSGPFRALHPLENTIKRKTVTLTMFWKWTVWKRVRELFQKQNT